MAYESIRFKETHWDKLIDANQKRRIKNILNSPFTLPILGGIWSHKRPVQIAQSLKTSPQVVNYYTARLIEVGLICKDKDNRIKELEE